MRLLKNTQTSNFIQICLVGAELLRVEGQVDGQADMTKFTITFCNFANAPKITCNPRMLSLGF